jgi:HEAT repeat protein
MPRPLALLAALVAAGAAAAGPGKKEADRAIADLRTATDAKTRAAALAEIGRLGQVETALVASAADDVVRCLTDKDPAVRAAAADAYGLIDPDPKEAVPALLKLFADDKETMAVRTAAARGLGAIGPGAAAARDELETVRKELTRKLRDAKPTTPAERMAVGQQRGLAQAAGNALTRIAGKKK